MRLLDLYCGAGGCSVGYARAGFDVIGVDLHPQPNYPYEFIQADVRRFAPHAFADFDAIHASPPCQAHSSLGSRYDRTAHPDLIAATRELLISTGLPYVIENVIGAPLVDPVMICGSSLGLGVRRHRLFETNWPLMAPPCAHAQQRAKYSKQEHGKTILSPVAAVYGTGGGKSAEQWPEAMGIDWMTRAELAQAVPPAMTELIGHQLAQYIRSTPAATTTTRGTTA